jgi:hypothetical protein
MPAAHAAGARGASVVPTTVCSPTSAAPCGVPRGSALRRRLVWQEGVEGAWVCACACLESGDDVELLGLVGPAARADRAAIHHHRRPVDSPHRHDDPGHVLVAARDRQVGVVVLRAHDRLNRVGDEIAALQRVGHAVGPIRDAVAHADGVEAQADHLAPLHCRLGLGGHIEQVHVARVALVPNGGDANLRLVHAIGDLAHVRRIQLRLTCSLRLALRDHGRIFVRRARRQLGVGQHGLVRPNARDR